MNKKMNIRYYFFIIPVCTFALLLQSCWKDKSLKDMTIDDMQVNISPSYGVPLAAINITGSDIVKRLNKNADAHNYYLVYDPLDNDLCVIVYDRTNLPLLLPPILNLDTVMSFPLSFLADLRVQGWAPKRALLDLYVDNPHTEEINFVPHKVEYDIAGGTRFTLSSGLPANPILARTSTTSKRSRVIDEFIVNDPINIIFNGENVYMDFSLSYNTILTSDALNLNPVMRVPMHITASGVERKDTATIDLSIIEDLFNDSVVSLQNVTLYLKLINGLPLDASLQLYFADANYRVLDSMQTERLFVKSGIPNPSTYLIDQTVESVYEISLPKEKYERIKGAKYLLLNESFVSYRGQDVKLFKRNELGIILSAKIDTKIQGRVTDINIKLD
jgi:hypothetical protein